MIAIFAGVLGLATAAPVKGAAAGVWVEVWRHEASRPLDGVAVGDIDGDGREEIVALSQGTVIAYGLDDEGPRFLAAVEGIPERPTAVAVRPFLDDKRGAVWVGTQDPGITYVFDFDPESRSFVRRERIRYAWGDIARLVPVDLDGQGGTDLAVVTAGRELVVFTATPSGYQRVDAVGAGRDVRFIEAADLDGDGREELVVGSGANHVAVLRWEATSAASETAGEATGEDTGSLAVTWENYVWGTHLGLAVGRFRGGAPEIVVASSQRVAHHFAHGQDGIRAVRTPMDWPGMGGNLIGSGDIDGDGRAEAIEATPSGIVAWSIGSQVSAKQTVELSRSPVSLARRDPATGRLLVAGARGFALLRLEDADYVGVLRRGVPYVPAKPPRFRDGVAYFSATDWEELLGVRLRFDPESGRITGLKGFRILMGRVGEGEWIYDGRATQTESRPYVEEGVLYLGADFGSVVGASVVWEPYTRTLVVYP